MAHADMRMMWTGRADTRGRTGTHSFRTVQIWRVCCTNAARVNGSKGPQWTASAALSPEAPRRSPRGREHGKLDWGAQRAPAPVSNCACNFYVHHQATAVQSFLLRCVFYCICYMYMCASTISPCCATVHQRRAVTQQWKKARPGQDAER